MVSMHDFGVYRYVHTADASQHLASASGYVMI